MLSTIFLSHNSKDKPFVRRLANDLRANGIKVWVDEAEILLGDSLLNKIELAISEMDFLGVVISKDSSESEWVKKEVEMAMTLELENKTIKVLPLLLDKQGKIPLFLRPKLYADFTDESKYTESVHMILTRLGVTNPTVVSTSLRDATDFEVLDTHVIMKINDTEGKNVSFQKSEKLVLKKEGKIFIPEEAGSDGSVDGFYVSNGDIDEVKKEEGLYRVKTHVVCDQCGQHVNRSFGWTAHNGFIEKSEYMLFKHDFPTPVLRINLEFPTERPPISCMGLIRIGNIDQPYHVQPVIINDTYPTVTWIISAPSDKDKFRLEWNW